VAHGFAGIIAPEHTGDAGATRGIGAVRFAQRAEAIILAALYIEGFGPAAHEAFAGIGCNDERALLIRSAGGEVGELRFDFIARRAGGPAGGGIRGEGLCSQAKREQDKSRRFHVANG
jgi:hypothetical protein